MAGKILDGLYVYPGEKQVCDIGVAKDIRKLLTSLKEAAQGRNAQREKVKNKDRGREL